MKRKAAAILAWRLLNVFAVRTFFQPDEYFQSWEPALALVGGPGFVTWEWDAGIRTWLVPILFAVIIRVSTALGIDYLLLGRVFMAIIATLADLGTENLAKRLVGPRYAHAALLLSLGSAWNWFVGPRPFSNTLEMAVVVWALTRWPFDVVDAASSEVSSVKVDFSGLRWACMAAQISIALRPSNGLLWMFLGCRLLWQLRRRPRVALRVLAVAAASSTIVQLPLILLDVHLGGRLPLVAFLEYNFGQRVSEIYGVMPWHYYLLQSLPLLLIAYLPIALLGLWRLGPWHVIVQLLLVHLIAFSCVAHKETRFVYYLLPLLHCAAATVARGMPTWVWTGMIAINLAVANYLGTYHQRGVVDVVNWARHADPGSTSFLMPCHSTPWQAHLQVPDAKFLTCDPPWNWSAEGYIDEADQFYADPTGFLAEHPQWLTHTVIVFEALLPLEILSGYKEQTRFFNSHFHEDPRRRGDVVVLQRVS